MDLRIQKTRKNIINAFISLRSHKSLEKISVKELAELAMINKATFYLHYKDIYDLADALEKELIHEVLNNISHPEAFISEPLQFNQELIYSLLSQGELFHILVSEDRRTHFAKLLEEELKKYIFTKYPEFSHDPEKNIMLTFLIQGSYHTYMQNSNTDRNVLINTIIKISDHLITLYS